MPNRKLLSLLGFLLLVFLIQWCGYKFTFTSVTDWYPTLHKPAWNPPAWVFGPVWTMLYLTIAVSGWFVFIKGRSCRQKKIAFVVYGFQLMANLLWSYLFFFLKNPGLALIDVWVLVFLIAINIAAFVKLYLPAAILLIPYFIWTLYAAFLNTAIWSLNR